MRLPSFGHEPATLHDYCVCIIYQASLISTDLRSDWLTSHSDVYRVMWPEQWSWISIPIHRSMINMGVCIHYWHYNEMIIALRQNYRAEHKGKHLGWHVLEVWCPGHWKEMLAILANAITTDDWDSRCCQDWPGTPMRIYVVYRKIEMLYQSEIPLQWWSFTLLQPSMKTQTQT